MNSENKGGKGWDPSQAADEEADGDSVDDNSTNNNKVSKIDNSFMFSAVGLAFFWLSSIVAFGWALSRRGRLSK